ncbi:IS1/IS1595 family N-terminal zinc-binding domain-containing protein [Nostoc sp.]
MLCPQYNSNNIVKNGRTHYRKQRFKCLSFWTTIC